MRASKDEREDRDKEDEVKMSRVLLTFLGFIIMYGPQATTYSVALPEVQDSLKCSDTELGLAMSVLYSLRDLSFGIRSRS